NGVETIEKTADGTPVISLKKDEHATFVFSPDSRMVVEAKYTRGKDEPAVRILSLPGGDELRRFGTRTPDAIAISPDGKTLAAGYWDAVALWDMRSGKRLAMLRGLGRYADSLTFSRNGALLAVGADEGKLEVWSVKHHKRILSLPVEGGNM